MPDRKLAVVTGASTGIGRELARCAAEDGFDLIICANEDRIEEAASDLRGTGIEVETVQADLGTEEGVRKLVSAVKDRPVDALMANVGVGYGDAFLDQNFENVESVIRINVLETLRLIHELGRDMRRRGEGRIMITSSIVEGIPGTYMAPYTASKAFLENFSYALRNELADSGVTVTCLMPGATDTQFFARADMEDTKIGQSDKADPAKVARDGYKAMKNGDSGEVSAGLMTTIQSTFSGIIPDTILSKMHERLAKPGGGSNA